MPIGCFVLPSRLLSPTAQKELPIDGDGASVRLSMTLWGELSQDESLCLNYL